MDAPIPNDNIQDRIGNLILELRPETMEKKGIIKIYGKFNLQTFSFM